MPQERGGTQSQFDRRFCGELEFKKLKTNHLKIGPRTPLPREQAVHFELLDGPPVAKVELGFLGMQPEWWAGTHLPPGTSRESG